MITITVQIHDHPDAAMFAAYLGAEIDNAIESYDDDGIYVQVAEIAS